MGKNWNYVSCRDKLQEIRGYENYVEFKKKYEDAVDLEVVNTVFASLEVSKLQPLIDERESFIRELEKSVMRIGFKDPFVVHNVTGVPIENKHGLFVKAGNNRIRLCNKFGITVVDCIVVNLTGGMSGEGCFVSDFVEGVELSTNEEVKGLFYIDNVRVTWRGDKIVNAYVPKFLKQSGKYK